MLTGMTERDWLTVLEVFDAAQSSRGEPGHDDRKFLEAIHYFTVHSITWRALPREYGKWNSVWKRFWRLSRSGVFEAFFQILAECSETAHLIQFFDSTTARAHVSAAGAKGGSSIRPSAARVAASRPPLINRTPTGFTSQLSAAGQYERVPRETGGGAWPRHKGDGTGRAGAVFSRPTQSGCSSGTDGNSSAIDGRMRSNGEKTPIHQPGRTACALLR